MKQKILLALGILIGVSLFATATARAMNAQSGDTLTISKEEVIDSSIYRFGKNINVAGTVKGDVYCAGQKIEISGTVEGDVICAGQEVRVSGTVQGDVRAAGQNVTVTGEVTGSLSAAGQTVSMEKTAKLGRDAAIAGQTTHLSGQVGRDADVSSQTTTLDATIGRNATVSGNEVSVNNAAVIGGGLYYTSNNQATIDKDAKIAGETAHRLPPAKDESQTDRIGGFMGPLNWIFSMLLLGGAFLLLLPCWFKGATTTMQQKPFMTAGLGLTGLVLTPIIAVGFVATIIGIPLGITVLILWLLAVFASFTFTAYSFGSWLLTKLPWLERGKELAALILGVLLLVLFMNVPYIGPWVGFLSLVCGLGGIYYAIGRSVRLQRAPVKGRKA